MEARPAGIMQEGVAKPEETTAEARPVEIMPMRVAKPEETTAGARPAGMTGEARPVGM